MYQIISTRSDIPHVAKMILQYMRHNKLELYKASYYVIKNEMGELGIKVIVSDEYEVNAHLCDYIAPQKRIAKIVDSLKTAIYLLNVRLEISDCIG